MDHVKQNRKPASPFAAFLIILIAFCGVGWASSTRGIVEISGDRFPAAIRLGEKTLPLRGGTLCRHRLFSVYTAAFYADPQASSVARIEGDTHKSLILHYHRDIEREDIIEASWQTLRRNPNIDLGALADQIDRMHAMFQDVRDGDRYQLDYIPGQGCALYFNGLRVGEVEGDEFAQAYFGIWISDYSIKDKYRDRILGL